MYIQRNTIRTRGWLLNQLCMTNCVFIRWRE